GDLELKTDADGKTSFDNVPYGRLRIQILASGFQTFGDDYEISQPKMSFTIRLKRPQGQYSIYQEHPEEKNNKTPPPAPNAKPQQLAPSSLTLGFAFQFRPSLVEIASETILPLSALSR